MFFCVFLYTLVIKMLMEILCCSLLFIILYIIVVVLMGSARYSYVSVLEKTQATKDAVEEREKEPDEEEGRQAGNDTDRTELISRGRS